MPILALFLFLAPLPSIDAWLRPIQSCASAQFDFAAPRIQSFSWSRMPSGHGGEIQNGNIVLSIGLLNSFQDPAARNLAIALAFAHEARHIWQAETNYQGDAEQDAYTFEYSAFSACSANLNPRDYQSFLEHFQRSVPVAIR